MFPRYFVTNELHIQNTFHNHKVVAEQVVKDLVVNNVSLKKILSRTRSYSRSIVQDSTIRMSAFEEDVTDLQNYSKTEQTGSFID